MKGTSSKDKDKENNKSAPVVSSEDTSLSIPLITQQSQTPDKDQVQVQDKNNSDKSDQSNQVEKPEDTKADKANVDTELLSLEEIQALDASAAGNKSSGSQYALFINAWGNLDLVYDEAYDWDKFNQSEAVQKLATEISLLPSDENAVIKVDNPVKIIDLIEGGDVVVDEDDLLDSRGAGESAGSDRTQSNTVNGDFIIIAPDGIKDLIVGGHDVIKDGVFLLAPNNFFMTPLGSTLTFLSFTPGALPGTAQVTYSYTLNDNQKHLSGDGENSLCEDFNVVLKDTDGSTVSNTLSVKIVDDVPSIVASESDRVENIVVDDTDIQTQDSSDFSGFFTSVPGADGATIKYTLGINESNNDSGLKDTLTDKEIYLFLEGEAVVGRAGMNPDDPKVFSITVDADTGVVTLNQSRAVVHDNPNDADEAADPKKLLSPDLIKLTATITDGDFDTASAIKNIGDAFSFKDDGPSISVNEDKVPTLTVDDSNFLIDDTKDFSGLFEPNFGKDGPKDSDNNDIPDSDAITYTLGLGNNIEGSDSGLKDTLTNDSVFLYLDGKDVVGLAGSSTGDEVFRITVDANTGVVTLNQIRSVVHDDPSDSYESGSAAEKLASADLIKLTATITDGDFDTASAIKNIGDAFSFKDDGPEIHVKSQAQVPTLTVDDSNFFTDDTKDFSGLFDPNFGHDGPKDSDNNDSPDSDAIKYTLSISGSGVVDSGLKDTLTGHSVLLTQVDDIIYGKTDGNTVFTITVIPTTGEVILDQQRAIVHVGDNDKMMVNDLVKLTATITDGDGDNAHKDVNIGGQFVFKDDQPVAIEDCHVCDPNKEEVIPPEWSINIQYLGTNAGYNNSFGYYFKDANGNPISGQIIWEGVKDNDNSDFTLTQADFIKIEGFNPCDIGYFIIPDGYNKNNTNDGYNDKAHVTFSHSSGVWKAFTGTTEVNGKDASIFFDNAAFNVDGYTHFNYIGDTGVLTANNYHWEDLVAGGDEDFNDVDVSIKNSFVCDPCDHDNAIITGNLLSNDMLSADAVNRVYAIRFFDQVVQPINVGEVYQSIQSEFVLLLNPNGSYTFNLTKPVTKDTVYFEYQLIDGDGSISNWAKFCFDVVPKDNDVPEILVTAIADPDALVVDESDFDGNATANFKDNFSIFSDIGGDDFGVLEDPVFTLSIRAPGADTGLRDMATNQSVVLSMNGTVVEGRTSGSNELVFKVFVNLSSGIVELDQKRPLNHPDANNSDDAVTLSSANLITLTCSDKITDGNGDSATSSASIDISQALSFEDDGPSFTHIHDTKLPLNGIVDIIANNPVDANVGAVPDVKHEVQLVDWSYGADDAALAPGSIVLNSYSGSGAVSQISSSNSQLKLEIKEGNTVVGVVTLNKDGVDSVDLYHRSNIIEEQVLEAKSVKAGGPGIYFVDIASVPNQTIRVMADGVDRHGDADGDFNPITDPSTDLVNPSNVGWAVDNNIIEHNESIRFESINKITPAVFIPIVDFSFKATGFTGGEDSFDIRVRVHYHNSTTPEDFYITVTEGHLEHVASLSGFNVGLLIDSVEIKNVDEDAGKNIGFRLNDISTYTETSVPPADLDYQFTVKIQDKDGDSTLQSFSLHIDGEQPLPLSPGYTVDGPIAGAHIFQDVNDNTIQDPNEAFTISNQVGAYKLALIDMNLDGVIDIHDGKLVSLGGRDVETNLEYAIPLMAPLGSEIISPLSSILAMHPEDNQALVEGLGLLPGTDLSKLNPMSELNALSQAAAIMTLSVQLSEAIAQQLGVLPANVAEEIYSGIGNQILALPKGMVADFTQGDFLHAIIEDVSHQVGLKSSDFDPIINLLTESQMALSHSVENIAPMQDSVGLISEVQHATQGVVAQAISQFYAGIISAEQLDHVTQWLHEYNQGEAKLSDATGLDLSGQIAEIVSDLSQSNDNSVLTSNNSESTEQQASTILMPALSAPAPEPEPILVTPEMTESSSFKPVLPSQDTW